MAGIRTLAEEEYPTAHSEPPRIELPRRDQIVAIPTLVRKLPQPIRKIIGDLSNTDRALIALEVRTQTAE